ncbi:MAG: zinc ribbon domain-containing protein [Ethanoligenens sp.]|uniref:zinc ribbon domain-containing protein n=1 Tax=Ethanoligenens sp. TaxID=2099655 RepID=UPI0039E8B9F7
MSFFDEIGNTLSAKSKDVAQKAKDFAEVTKLSSQISHAEEAIQRIYTQIGHQYFERFAEKDDSVFVNEIRQIRQNLTDIASIQKQIKLIRGVYPCPQCGADVPNGSAFCPSCGRTIDAANAASDVLPQHTCVACGAALPPDARFCRNCGAKQEQGASDTTRGTDAL